MVELQTILLAAGPDRQPRQAAVLVVLLDHRRGRHPVERFHARATAVGPHHEGAVGLDHQQPHGLRQHRAQPAGVGHLAARDDQAHRATVSRPPVRPAGVARRGRRSAAAVVPRRAGGLLRRGCRGRDVGRRRGCRGRDGRRLRRGRVRDVGGLRRLRGGAAAGAPAGGWAWACWCCASRWSAPASIASRNSRTPSPRRRASSGRRFGPSTTRATMPMNSRWTGLSMPICPPG